MGVAHIYKAIENAKWKASMKSAFGKSIALHVICILCASVLSIAWFPKTRLPERIGAAISIDLAGDRPTLEVVSTARSNGRSVRAATRQVAAKAPRQPAPGSIPLKFEPRRERVQIAMKVDTTPIRIQPSTKRRIDGTPLMVHPRFKTSAVEMVASEPASRSQTLLGLPFADGVASSEAGFYITEGKAREFKDAQSEARLLQLAAYRKLNTRVISMRDGMMRQQLHGPRPCSVIIGIFSDGRTELRIASSSGRPALDEKCLARIQQALPFQPREHGYYAVAVQYWDEPFAEPQNPAQLAGAATEN